MRRQNREATEVGGMVWGRRALRALGLAVVFAVSALGLGRGMPASGQTSDLGAPEPAVTAPGFQPSWLDRHCAPCDDFYGFATGGWRSANPIPEGYPAWDQFYVLYAGSLDRMHDLLEDAAADRNAPPGSARQKVGLYYKECLDEIAVEAGGVHPLDAELAKISAVSDVPGVLAEFAHLERGPAPGTPFAFTSAPDPANAGRTIGDLSQSGLTLPDRDTYLNASPAAQKIRDAYTAHVAKMFQLLGDNAATAQTEAATVLGVETKLAQASVTDAERRDVAKTTNHFTVETLQSTAHTISWAAYFAAVGASQTTDLNVDEPSFFTALDGLLSSIPVADWKTYLRWRVLDAASPALPKAFVDERFAFTQVLSGTPNQQPRWRRCVGATDDALGEAVGQLYTEAYFSAAAKARAVTLVNNVQSALREDLTTLAWMSPATRSYAIAKLDALRKKIGYPDRPIDYATLVPQSDSYLANRYRAAAFAWDDDMAKIGKPTNRDAWGVTAQTVNAQYNPPNNDITFPAGILQPPFFDPASDDVLNYGAIGAIIGHEMTRALDDQGRLYDAQGNLHDWWTAADAQHFNARARCMSDLYDTLPVDGTQKQKGSLVAGEAIADLGGLTIAYAAFERAEGGKPRSKIAGFTPEQRFFIAFATVWAENERPDAARLRAETDVHAVGRNRVVGTILNMPEFAKAWYCPLTAKMVRAPAQRCRIW